MPTYAYKVNSYLFTDIWTYPSGG